MLVGIVDADRQICVNQCRTLFVKFIQCHILTMINLLYNIKIKIYFNDFH